MSDQAALACLFIGAYCLQLFAHDYHDQVARCESMPPTTFTTRLTTTPGETPCSAPRYLHREWKRNKPVSNLCRSCPLNPFDRKHYQHLQKSTSLPALQLVPTNRPLFTCRRCGFTNTLIPLCLWCSWTSEAAHHEFEASTPRARRASAPPRVAWKQPDAVVAPTDGKTPRGSAEPHLPANPPKSPSRTRFALTFGRRHGDSERHNHQRVKSDPTLPRAEEYYGCQGTVSSIKSSRCNIQRRKQRSTTDALLETVASNGASPGHKVATATQSVRTCYILLVCSFSSLSLFYSTLPRAPGLRRHHKAAPGVV